MHFPGQKTGGVQYFRHSNDECSLLSLLRFILRFACSVAASLPTTASILLIQSSFNREARCFWCCNRRGGIVYRIARKVRHGCCFYYSHDLHARNKCPPRVRCTLSRIANFACALRVDRNFDLQQNRSKSRPI